MTAPSLFEQSGVVPLERVDGEHLVVLIRNRSDTRWIVPKGLVEPHLTRKESALAEAYEEAGVRGVVVGSAVGMYEYRKWGGVCRVRIYPMKVKEVLDDWPESFRERIWVGVDEAPKLVDSVDLSRLIRRAARAIGA